MAAQPATPDNRAPFRGADPIPSLKASETVAPSHLELLLKSDRAPWSTKSLLD